MTGKQFLKFIGKRGIPLSCIAAKLGCKLETLRDLCNKETMPMYYIKRFIAEFKDRLTRDDIALLTS